MICIFYVRMDVASKTKIDRRRAIIIVAITNSIVSPGDATWDMMLQNTFEDREEDAIELN
jgi:hypothetical protein